MKESPTVWWAAVSVVGTALFFVLRRFCLEALKSFFQDYLWDRIRWSRPLKAFHPLAKARQEAETKLRSFVKTELARALPVGVSHDDFDAPVRAFVQHDSVQATLDCLLAEDEYRLDHAIYSQVWLEVGGLPPERLDWTRVVREIEDETSEIRKSHSKLKSDSRWRRFKPADRHGASTEGVTFRFGIPSYRDALIKQFELVNIEQLGRHWSPRATVNLQSVFVPQRVREFHAPSPEVLESLKAAQNPGRTADPGRTRSPSTLDAAKAQHLQDFMNQRERPILEVVANPELAHIVLLGDPGHGKTSLLVYLALHWAQKIETPAIRDQERVPFLVDLKNYDEWECTEGKGFLKFLINGPYFFNFDIGEIEALFNRPNGAVLYLDGLDEIFDKARRKTIVKNVANFCTSYPHTRIVLTSRFFVSETNALVGHQFKHFAIQDLKWKEIDRFITSWHEMVYGPKSPEGNERAEMLRRALQETAQLALLGRNPLLLTFMAIINHYGRLPKRRAELYEEISNLLLEEWDTAKALAGVPGMSTEVDIHSKEAILRNVAYAMQRSESGLRGNTIGREALNALVTDYLRDELEIDKPRTAATALIEQLRSRSFVLCRRTDSSLYFTHRTFLEYFCAMFYVEKLKNDANFTFRELRRLFEEHAGDGTWHEVLILIGSQIDSKSLCEIVIHLVKRIEIDHWDGYQWFPELLLAIRLAGEISAADIPRPCVLCLCEAIADLYFNEEIKGRTHPTQVGQAAEFLRRINWVAYEVAPSWTKIHGQGVFAARDPRQLPNFARKAWPYLIAIVDHNREVIMEYVNSGISFLREGAVEALAKNWRNEETRKVLHNLATKERVVSVRETAIVSLAQFWRDDSSWHLLTELVLGDWSITPFLNRCRHIAYCFPNEQTREFLLDVAKKRESIEERKDALQVLAGHWHDEVAREQLKEFATNDENADIRIRALNMLIHLWTDPDTLEFLLSRVRAESPELKPSMMQAAEVLKMALEKGGPVIGIFESTSIVLRATK